MNKDMLQPVMIMAGGTGGHVYPALAVADELKQWRWLPELRFINHYHDHPGYITALADSVKKHWASNGRPDKLVMSFHGIPQDYFDKGDPYHCECQKTGRLLAEALELSPEQWALTFQSRLGPKQWLKPYTDHSLREMGQQGVKRVDMICPGFAADCLETLEEIAMENRDEFLGAGGEAYHYIPCLNANADHIAMLTELVAEHCQGWPEVTAAADPQQQLDRLNRARDMGADQ